MKQFLAMVASPINTAVGWTQDDGSTTGTKVSNAQQGIVTPAFGDLTDENYRTRAMGFENIISRTGHSVVG